MPPEICIVAPCFNEEAVIEAFYRELRAVVDRIPGIAFSSLVVDDGSTDSTLARLQALAQQDSSLRVVSLSRNFGHQMALSAGLDAAEGDAVILMDSDLQHPPALLPEMVALWQQGFDVVSALREDTDGVPLGKKLSSRLFYAVFNAFSDTPLIPGAADFCLLSRRAYEALRAMPERHRLLRGMVSWIGFRRAQIPYHAPARFAGQSKYGFTRMFGLATDAVFSFSAAPIRLPLRIGLLAVLGASIYLIYILIVLASGDAVRGWASIICVVIALNGIQLIFMGLMGEYLSRIYDENKRRPLYLVKFDTSDSSPDRRPR